LRSIHCPKPHRLSRLSFLTQSFFIVLIIFNSNDDDDEAQETPPRRALILPKLNSSDSLMSNPSPGDSSYQYVTPVVTAIDPNVEVLISFQLSVIDV
jgi:hypothetical protein